MQNTQVDREQGIGTMSRSMLIVMILTMVGKVAGFVREMVFASQFGAEVVKSAYTTAQTLPCIFLSIIITALSATLIPAYSAQLKQGREQAGRFVNNIYTVGMVVSVIVLIITALLLEPLTNFVMRGTEDMETRRLTVQLAQIMMPMGIFVFLTRITSAYLQANFNFTIPALSQLFLNIVIIGAVFASGGVNITYVAIGTVIGFALQFAVQIPAARRSGLAYRPVFDLKEAGIREVLMLMLPVLISSAFDQVYMLFDQMVAYGGDIGDPGKLDYANRLSTMVSSVLLTTVATVLYPNLVKSAGDRKRFTDNLSFGINLNLLIAIPAIVALMLLCVPVTRLVYERGKFTAESTLLTAPLLAAYAAGILGVGLRELCNRCFYAYKDTIVPTVTGVAVVVSNVVLNYLLHAVMGAPGIAAATSISVMGSSVLLIYLLHRKLGVVDWRRIGQCLWKVLAASLAMGAVLLAIYFALGMGAATGMRLLMGMGLAFIAGVAVYVIMLLLLRTQELGMLVDVVRQRLGRSK